MKLSALLAIKVLIGAASALRSSHHLRSHHATHAELIEGLSEKFPARYLATPIDHFLQDPKYANHSTSSFPQHYWVDTSHYRPGGPVIVLLGGETSGANRLPYIEHGIGAILARATGGVVLILEHRYYGKSLPDEAIVPDFSPYSLRFLDTEQALADTAFFAKEAPRFPGLEDVDLSAGPDSDTPWILYGGSYAGAFAALARKIYPDIFWAAISSSGVTAAVEDYWEYYEAARHFAPEGCAEWTQKLTAVVDANLIDADVDLTQELKTAFGLAEVDDDAFFAGAISQGISGLQATNWDPAEDHYDFGSYCAVVTSGATLYQSMMHAAPVVRSLVAVADVDQDDIDEITAHMLNYMGYVNDGVQKRMQGECKGKSIAECFNGWGSLENSSRDNEGRLWMWQVCTQWGYFQTGSGVPEDIKPLVSRAITLEHESRPCRDYFNTTSPPDVDSINRHGGYNFSFPRVALIDGAQDPWRAATPHRIPLEGEMAIPRNSTASEPFILIDYGVHHWDENGVFDDLSRPGLPPPQIMKVQDQEVEFLTQWLKEFKEERAKKEDGPGEL